MAGRDARLGAVGLRLRLNPTYVRRRRDVCAG
jgi:hypothetical protein